MPAWRELAGRLDRTVVETFDYGDVSLQKMANGVPSGDPIPLPAEFQNRAIDVRVADGVEVSTDGPAVTIHDGHLADAGVTVDLDDRIVIGSGPAAGTYVVDDVSANDDRTGSVVRLKRASR